VRVYAFPDPRGCGDAVLAAAKHRGHEAIASIACANAAYVRTVNYGHGREQCLQALKMFGDAHLPCIPGAGAADWYDDKLAQVDLLRDWMPDTLVQDTRDGAIAHLPANVAYPFISKTAFGSGSANVRLIRNEAEARAEIDAAFGPGLPVKGGVQQGYVYWQELIPGNTRDIRVIVAGRRLYGLIRQCRDDVPFASGSGRTSPIMALDDPQVRNAFSMADEIAETINAPWSCYDFVFDGDRPYCLEVSTSWTEASYTDCAVFDRATLEPTGEAGGSWPDFVIDELERLTA
jgi:glutathione synthase/RimK-type ligase-like ATP-grasp enzyme